MGALSGAAPGGDRALLAALGAALGDLAVADAPLGSRTTYRVGGRAALLVEANDVGALAAVHDALVAVDAPVALLVVGQGSNLLVADAGFPGLVVTLGPAFAEIAVEGTTVRAGGAAKLPVLARRSARAGLRGLEWAVGIPGSVGGALRMNAGGHGADVAAVLADFRTYDLATGEDRREVPEALHLGYRRSSLGPSQVVLEAAFALSRGERHDAQAAVDEVVRWRRAHQPGGSNAGSVFTNPEGDSAGRLVEAAGCKGLRLGSAQVSVKHANFFQADAGGSADDVARLVEHVRVVVAERTGVGLVPELCMVGFDPPPVVRARSGRAQPSPSTGGRAS